MSLAKRIASRYMRANTQQSIKSVDMSLSMLTKWKNDLAAMAATLEALIAAGEARRLGRISDIKIVSQRGNEDKITAVMQGTSGKYDTRITLKPKRGHHCTCPDWQKRGRQIGPCKHVLALGQYWLHEKVDPALDRIDDGLFSLVEKMDL